MTATARYYRVRMIMCRWHVLLSDAKDRAIETLGPYAKLHEAETAGKATGLQDRDKVTL